jgi:hypothetical protein
MARAAKNFPAIYSTEQVALSFNFAPALAPGETLLTSTSTPAVSVVVVAGTDAAPSSRLIGTPVIIGLVVVQMVGTLQGGAIYDWSATVGTSAGQILTLNSHQTCESLQ